MSLAKRFLLPVPVSWVHSGNLFLVSDATVRGKFPQVGAFGIVFTSSVGKCYVHCDALLQAKNVLAKITRWHQGQLKATNK